MVTIKIYGKLCTPEVSRLKEFLSRHLVEFELIDLRNDEDCQKHLNMACLDNIRLPVVDIDGQKLFEPSEKEIAQKLNFNQKPRLKQYDLAIFGAGPAGLSAAVYAAFEGINTILVERKAIGGQAGSSPLIENFLGFPEGISGTELTTRAVKQAIKLGVEVALLREGVGADFSNNMVTAVLDDHSRLSSYANICACGVEYRRLGIPNEDSFLHAGVFYGAGATEAVDCAGETVVVVGGGNGAGQATLNFAKTAAKVILVIRGPKLSCTLSHHLIKPITENKTIEILYNSRVTALNGSKWLSEVEITTPSGITTIPTHHLFVCIGGQPHTDYFKDTPVIRDEAGYVVTGPDLLVDGKLPENWKLKRHPFFLETNIPGLFAIGDVRHDSVKRLGSAVGEGAMAIAFVQRYLMEAFGK
jgi:thioredoxin reductase (NADPH)